MATKQPVRSGYDVFLKDLLALFGGSSIRTELSPYGGYSGLVSGAASSESPIATNPWGTPAQLRYTDSGSRDFRGTGGTLVLSPGQSYNFITGQLSDPNLHAGTAKRLNEALQYRTINAAGLEQANKTTARESKSVLATLDEMYFGNVNTEVVTSSARTNLGLANEQGFNTDGTRTILGADTGKKPTAAKTPLKRALT